MKMPLRCLVFSILYFVSLNLTAQDHLTLQSLAEEYNEVVSELRIPTLQPGYLDNLNSILDEESRNEQKARFAAIQESLERLDYQALERESQYYYQHLNYRLVLQLERLDLENRFKELMPGQVDATTGIYHQPLGKEWYQYFLDRWLSVSKSPEELFVFGETEVLKVLGQIKEVQEQAGFVDDADAFYQHLNDDEFILGNEKDVIEGYQLRKAVVQQHLGELFRNIDVPDVRIEPFPESNKDTVPGQLVFTPDPTFRFNFFEQRHNTQDLDFLYLHEVVPGHAFHAQYNQDFPHDAYNLGPIWAYSGFAEGWGAYVEELGEELGLYQTPWLKMGSLKFDLVRSARVVLDVGINYFGWDNQRALDYWFAHIRGQDQIAQREIDRVRRWPGQAISYKVGAAKLLELRTQAQDALGPDFDIREFHHLVLAFGGVPLFLVERRILDYIQLG
jgi:uncharacterized protein (DUF885 family)